MAMGCKNHGRWVRTVFVARKRTSRTRLPWLVITGPAFTILFSKLQVKLYQLVKISGSKLEIRIKKDDGYSDETEQIIINSISKYAGKEISIKLNYDHEFKLLTSGKRNYFINN